MRLSPIRTLFSFLKRVFHGRDRGTCQSCVYSLRDVDALVCRLYPEKWPVVHERHRCEEYMRRGARTGSS